MMYAGLILGNWKDQADHELLLHYSKKLKVVNKTHTRWFSVLEGITYESVTYSCKVSCWIDKFSMFESLDLTTKI